MDRRGRGGLSTECDHCYIAVTENQGESLAVQGGDESDNSSIFHRLIARQDIPRCANTYTIK